MLIFLELTQSKTVLWFGARTARRSPRIARSAAENAAAWQARPANCTASEDGDSKMAQKCIHVQVIILINDASPDKYELVNF